MSLFCLGVLRRWDSRALSQQLASQVRRSDLALLSQRLRKLLHLSLSPATSVWQDISAQILPGDRGIVQADSPTRPGHSERIGQSELAQLVLQLFHQDLLLLQHLKHSISLSDQNLLSNLMICQQCFSESLSFLDNRPSDLKHFPVLSSNRTTDLNVPLFSVEQCGPPIEDPASYFPPPPVCVIMTQTVY